MKITVTYLAKLAKDNTGLALPVGDGVQGGQTLTAFGAATAVPAKSKFARIATDTALLVNPYGNAAKVLLPANTVEFFPVETDQVLTFEAA